jgi:hypothetical protein
VSTKIACCVKQLFRISFRRKEHHGKRDTQQTAEAGADHWSPDKCWAHQLLVHTRNTHHYLVRTCIFYTWTTLSIFNVWHSQDSEHIRTQNGGGGGVSSFPQNNLLVICREMNWEGEYTSDSTAERSHIILVITQHQLQKTSCELTNKCDLIV